MYRILVSGSRHGFDKEVFDTILGAYVQLGLTYEGEVTIIHGAAKGVDSMCDEWESEDGVTIERYPADWTLGKAAGHIRNQTMVDTGADILLAFKYDFNMKMDNGGTENCTKKAIAAGIPHIIITGKKR